MLLNSQPGEYLSERALCICTINILLHSHVVTMDIAEPNNSTIKIISLIILELPRLDVEFKKKKG